MVNYRLKTINDDFIVDEVSLIPPFFLKNNSTYTYLILKKSGWTTFDAQEEIKKYFTLEYKDISVEGLKDEDAITSQLVSMAIVIKESDLKGFNKKFHGKNYLSLSLLGYGNLPINPGGLHGNCFKITIRDLSKKYANMLYEYCAGNQFTSFINYYDSQRFGTPGSCYNTHLIGKALSQNNWDLAIKEFFRTENSEIKRVKEEFKNSSAEQAFKIINPNKIKFFVKSYNSYLWNRELSRDIYNRNKCKSYLFKHVGKLFLPTDHCIINPIFSSNGYNYLIDEDKIQEKVMKRTSYITTNIKCYEPQQDKLFNRKYSIMLDFFLPTGSYGTMLIRQLLIKIIEGNE
ncbi:MAG: tRNA pseudouridine synthase D [bacterium ADurb.Bin212]|nr:MAG: tRNA pseudouridine synthase D [bacterium ADurb.Bin212]